jgi:hypothetical protein
LVIITTQNQRLPVLEDFYLLFDYLRFVIIYGEKSLSTFFISSELAFITSTGRQSFSKPMIFLVRLFTGFGKQYLNFTYKYIGHYHWLFFYHSSVGVE